MTEYRVTIAWADDPATVEDHVERIAEAFADKVPEYAPAVGANLHTGTLEVTFAIDGGDDSIGGLAVRIGSVFAQCAVASGLYASTDEIDITRAEFVAVEAEKREQELQPA